MASSTSSAEALISLRNGDDDPHNDVKIVTLTVGGNENFNPLRSCDTGLPPEQVEPVATLADPEAHRAVSAAMGG